MNGIDLTHKISQNNLPFRDSWKEVIIFGKNIYRTVIIGFGEPLPDGWDFLINQQDALWKEKGD